MKTVRPFPFSVTLSSPDLAPLKPLCDFIAENSLRNVEDNFRNLSVAAFLVKLREEPIFLNTEIGSEDELRRLLKAMGFKWSNIHPDYYERIFDRPDIVAHRERVIPLLYLLETDSRYFAVFADASHSNQNDMAPHGWVDLTVRNSNLLSADSGKGRRLTWWTAMSQFGILVHPDGASAGTVLPVQGVMDHLVAYECIERTCEAMVQAQERRNRIPVLIIDGATVQKMFRPSAAVPKLVVLYHVCLFRLIHSFR